jgi:hypothetical protein
MAWPVPPCFLRRISRGHRPAGTQYILCVCQRRKRDDLVWRYFFGGSCNWSMPPTAMLWMRVIVAVVDKAALIGARSILATYCRHPADSARTVRVRSASRRISCGLVPNRACRAGPNPSDGGICCEGDIVQGCIRVLAIRMLRIRRPWPEHRLPVGRDH